jgi:hypothetical protein
MAVSLREASCARSGEAQQSINATNAVTDAAARRPRVVRTVLGRTFSVMGNLLAEAELTTRIPCCQDSIAGYGVNLDSFNFQFAVK